MTSHREINTNAQASKARLIRLANSCERQASRGGAVTAVSQDLDADDFRTIAEILRAMANLIRDR